MLNHSVNASNSESLAALQQKISVPSIWGFGERLVPDHMADDPASQRILEINLLHYELAARQVSGRRVLDIACGSGYGSKILKQAGAKSVVGVDLSSDAIRYAQQRYPDEGIEFICADAASFDWPEQFDVIVSFETIEHLPHPDQFLRRLRSLLVAKGDFYLSVPLGETRHFDPYHLHAFTQLEFFNLLENAGFAVELHRCDDLFLTRAQLNEWEKLYPNAPKPSVRELLLTGRGRRTLLDLLWRGGLSIPQLFVATRPSL